MSTTRNLGVLVAILCNLLSGHTTYGKFGIKTSLSGYYRLFFNDKIILWNDRSHVVVNDKVYTSDNLLKLDLDGTTKSTFTDEFGTWDVMKYIYYADDVPFEFSIKSNTVLPVVIFTQKYLQDVRITIELDNFTASGFPAFQVPFFGNYGYLGFGGNWAGNTLKQAGRFRADHAILSDGVSGTGPLCIFDTDGSAIVISPLNNFLTASTYFKDRRRYMDGSLHYGINKDVKYIPAGYEQQTVIHYSSKGVNSAFEEWGAFMKKWYKKPTDSSPLDITLQTLGYWMDYGSYYYNNIPKNTTYSDTILQIQSRLYPKLPLQYIELDEWWSVKDNNGMLSWKPSKQSLPDGFSILHDKLHIQTVLRAGQWSPNNTYSTNNGGNFTFVSSSKSAVPTQEEFWDNIFELSKSMGMKTMIQDNLMEQMLEIDELRSSVTLARQWLVAMGKSALRHGIPIQYSNALPSHALQTLEIPAVTQIRVSEDYMKDRDQWKIGVTSILVNALGLVPSKDTFWNNEQEPGNRYNATERTPQLQNMIATLSMGPVAIGDQIDFNQDVDTLRCCREDGVVLRPSRSLTSTDAQIMKMALNVSTIPTGQFMSTHTKIGDLEFGIITIVDASDITLTPSFIFNKNATSETVIYMHYSFDNLFPFSEEQPFRLSNCGRAPPFFCLAFTSPIIHHRNVKINILGEPFKWVPISPQRVVNITLGDDVVVTVAGKPGYIGSFAFAIDGVTKTVTFKIMNNGFASITIISGLSTTTMTTTTTTSTSTSTSTTRDSDVSSSTVIFQPSSLCHFLIFMTLYYVFHRL